MQDEFQGMMFLHGLRLVFLSAIGLGVLFIGEPDLHDAIVKLVLSWSGNE